MFVKTVSFKKVFVNSLERFLCYNAKYFKIRKTFNFNISILGYLKPKWYSQPNTPIKWSQKVGVVSGV